MNTDIFDQLAIGMTMMMQGLNIVNDSAYLRPYVFIGKMCVVMFDLFF